MARMNDASAYAYAFDLLAIDGDDTRKLPLLERKAALAKLLRKAKPGSVTANTCGDGRVIFDKPARSALKASCRSASIRRIGPASKSWLKLKNPKAPGYLRHAQS